MIHPLTRASGGSGFRERRDLHRRPAAGRPAQLEASGPPRSGLPVGTRDSLSHPGLVVGEEDLTDEIATAMHTRLLEDSLEVLLDGVR